MKHSTTLIEAGDPVADNRAFRRCLGQFATGVTVMTARNGDALAGMSVNSFSALSLDPPLVLWSIRRESGSFPVFSGASHFAVNVLSSAQVEISNLFSKSGEDKFAKAKWVAGESGAPLLEGTIASMECRLEQLHEGGDHYIVVGRVERHARFSGEPLVFTQGRYAVTQEHPGVAAAVPARSPCPPDAADGSLMRLLHFTSHQMSAWFDEHRAEEGLTVAQFRIYGWLRTQSRTLDQLKQLAYLGARDADDAVADLLDRGHIFKDEAGTLSLTGLGRTRADASARRVGAFESQLFASLPPEDVAATRRVLGSLAQRTAAV